MRISDWSSDVCSSDLGDASSYSRSQTCPDGSLLRTWRQMGHIQTEFRQCGKGRPSRRARDGEERTGVYGQRMSARRTAPQAGRSEEQKDEIKALLRIKCDVFCLKAKNTKLNTLMN